MVKMSEKFSTGMKTPNKQKQSSSNHSSNVNSIVKVSDIITEWQILQKQYVPDLRSRGHEGVIICEEHYEIYIVY